MAEIYKIYLSGCQEAQSNTDKEFSRHFKYKMNILPKESKIGRMFMVLFLMLLTLFVIFLLIFCGILLYPKLIRQCTKQSYGSQGQDSETKGYTTSIGKILSSMGICIESCNDTFAENMELKYNQTKTSISKTDSQLKNNYECKCVNSNTKLNSLGKDSKSENKTKLIDDGDCDCNRTDDTHYFNRENANVVFNSHHKETEFDKDTKDGNSDINTYTTNAYEYSGYTTTMNEKNNLPTNECDCAKIHEMQNHELNGTEPKSSDTNALNESVTEKEIFYANVTKENGCICIEEIKVQEFHVNGSNNENRMQDMKIMDNNEFNDITNFSFNGTENQDLNETNKGESLNTDNVTDKSNFHLYNDGIMNESLPLMKEKCVCPKIRNRTYVLFNGTKLNDELNGIYFGEDNECQCSNLHGNEYIHLNDSRSHTKQYSFTTLNSEECICSDISQAVTNESTTAVKKTGILNEIGECVCSLNENIPSSNMYFNATNENKTNYTKSVTELYNSDTVEGSPFNETESSVDIQYNKGKSCLCPKTHIVSEYASNITDKDFNNSELSEDGECNCTDSEIPNESSFQANETLIQNYHNGSKLQTSEECICPEDSTLLTHEETHGEITNETHGETGILGVKNKDCICPYVRDLNYIHDNETDHINEKDLILNHTNDFQNVEELTSIHKTETSTHDDNVTYSTNVQSREKEKVVENVLNSKNESNSLNFEEVTNVHNIENI